MAHGGHGSGLLLRARHDRGIQLRPAIARQRRTAPGIKERIIFKHAHAGRYRIQACAATIENRKARIKCERETRSILLGTLVSGAVARHRACPAMNCERMHIQTQSRSGKLGSPSLSRFGRARAAINFRAAI
jgi:hypothetical protein